MRRILRESIRRPFKKKTNKNIRITNNMKLVGLAPNSLRTHIPNGKRSTGIRIIAKENSKVETEKIFIKINLISLL